MGRLARKTTGQSRIRTLACRRDRIREGVAMITSGFSDMIILDEFGVELAQWGTM